MTAIGCRSRRAHRALSAVCAVLAATAMALLPGQLFRGPPSARPPARPPAAATNHAVASTPPVRGAGQDPASRASAVRAGRRPAAGRTVRDVGHRIQDAGYDPDWAAANVGWTGETRRSDPRAPETGMLDEVPADGHRQSVGSARVSVVGIDGCVGGANHEV